MKVWNRKQTPPRFVKERNHPSHHLEINNRCFYFLFIFFFNVIVRVNLHVSRLIS
jgi:hypothetical protein